MNLDSHRHIRLLSLTLSKSKKLERCCNRASLIVAKSTASIEANAFSGRSDSEHVEGSLTRNEIDGLEVLMAAMTRSADDDDDDEKSMAGALIDLQRQCPGRRWFIGYESKIL
ncbi:hypothetical protein E1A91_A05G340600v1 [Gossypium mustelinum]|uniref:Uncharacterized protein n=4 Tax=Gossypium TaxID=3633 RepID=A0ABR0Q266_GOSAR|nr:hypothetical protein ES319_1Z167400v1 [Gossypium barbadense]KAK5833410.1 hypothetical protein PVK06_017235 [Gossypium arboreum]TYH19358.1 hypothetical protein ES288_A05G345500v1 [Gossypium darwinii]TYJ36914.1 hypothetical protein E1A91_A05G340600v1 [Gossypium mustelinum]